MTLHSRRSGSALIIVLGFLSFMVVSAVAFSIYMRTERVATSGFHKSVAVRQMVKAGLANAIAQIDYAVGDDPFPGLSRNNQLLNCFTNECVFCPVPLDSQAYRPVRVLPFEGLAYLPPAIVNEVREASRVTPTAAWQNLDYDVGRFAYVAINVSDFFDINKVRCNTQRSSAPGGHVSLAYLFQKNEKGNQLDTSANLRKIDDFLENRGVEEQDVPFVSLADFNVALFKQYPGYGESLGIYSPFYGYLYGKRGSAFYSNGGSESAELVERAGRMLFVTDSWQLPTNRTDEVIDLAKDEDQPFLSTAFDGDDNPITFATLFSKYTSLVGNAWDHRLKNEISLTTLANLYDYLDDNSQPVSLAIPNVERVPMVAVVNGTTLSSQLKFSLEPDKPVYAPYNNGGQQQGSMKVKTVSYPLQVGAAQTPMVNVVFMYPFKGPVKRQGESASKKYSVQVIAKIFFTTAGANDAKGWSGRCTGGSGINPSRSEWENNANKAYVENNCLTLVSSKQAISKMPSEVSIDEDAVFSQMVQLPSLNAINTALKSMFLLQVQTLVKETETGGELELTSDPKYPNVSSFELLPFEADPGNADGAQVVASLQNKDSVRDKNAKLEEANCWKTPITPHVALWARVIDEKGKTVDLAPAILSNDELNGGMAGGSVNTLNTKFGDGSTLMPMLAASGKQVVFSKEERSVTIDGGDPLVFSGSAAAFAALDPRFNNSPEDFIAKSGGLAEGPYLQEVRSILGKEGRDPDIFMFTSDQKYLQSIGELAFLPNLGEKGEYFGDYNFKEYPYARCTVPQAFQDSLQKMDAKRTHCGSFWRTYPLYSPDGDNAIDAEDCIFQHFSTKFESDDWIIANDQNGYKVNPYTSIEKIRLAVTANTPYDFWAASTNSAKVHNNKPPCFTGAGNPEDIKTSLKYCFNELTDDAHFLDCRDLTNITERMFRQMRADALKGSPIDWEESFSSMDWASNGDSDRIFGGDLDNSTLDSIDRKMMYSFWHDSMSNRQQLFLVFVRVEAIPVGANDSYMDAEDDASKVQAYGGRAVALVWRDPAPPRSAEKVIWYDTSGSASVCGRPRSSGSSYAPHRTRLLFYHQFD